jgi:hypothetical protein
MNINKNCEEKGKNKNLNEILQAVMKEIRFKDVGK